MLSVPEKGIGQLETATGINTSYVVDVADILADWIEASAIFLKINVSQAGVAEALNESHIVSTQEGGYTVASEVWQTMQARAKYMAAGYPIRLERNSISAHDDIKQFCAYTFFLALSITPLYPAWARSLGHNYTKQGAFFEKIVKAQFERLFPGWKSLVTGWRPGQAQKLSKVAESIAAHVGTAMKDTSVFGNRIMKQNEAGLDVFCFRPFADNRGAIPTILLQCASGENWDTKLHEPSIPIWKGVVEFLIPPAKVFAIPFALSSNSYKFSALKTEGLLLDRLRLLEHGPNCPVSRDDDLERDIWDWLERRALSLKKYAFDAGDSTSRRRSPKRHRGRRFARRP